MNRRGFLFGGTTLLVAPAIVRVSSLMPISVLRDFHPAILRLSVNDYGLQLSQSFIETKEIYGANILNRYLTSTSAWYMHDTAFPDA